MIFVRKLYFKKNLNFRLFFRVLLRNYKISYIIKPPKDRRDFSYSFCKLFSEYKLGKYFMDREHLDSFDPFIQTYCSATPPRDYYPAVEVFIDMLGFMENHRGFSMPRFIFDQWEELFKKSETDSFYYTQLYRHLVVFFIKVSRRERYKISLKEEPREVWPEFLRGDQFEDFYNKVMKEKLPYYTDPFYPLQALTKYGPFEPETHTVNVNEKKRIYRQAKLVQDEIDRKKNIEKQKAIELEIEMEKKREIERQKEMEKQKEIAIQREIERQKEMEKQKEIAIQREIERQKEMEKQKEIAIQRKIERQKEMEKQKEIAIQRKIERKKEILIEKEIAAQKRIERDRKKEELLLLEKQRKMERKKEILIEREIAAQKRIERDREREKKKEIKKEIAKQKRIEKQQNNS